MKKILGWTTIVVGVMIAIGATTADATNVPYTVEDYIPVLFKDAQLMVGGTMRFSGSGYDFSNDSAGGSYARTESNESQYDNFSFAANSYYRKRYTTVEQWYDYSAQFVGDFQRSKSTSGNSSTSLSGNIYSSSQESKANSLNPRIYQDFDVAKYLAGDFMVSARSSLTYQYRKIGKNDRWSFDQSINLAGNTATRYTQTSNTEQPGDNKAFSITGDILFGEGRMYEGVYAFTAISLIEELDREGLLLRTPSSDEMAELTEIIYQRRLKHAIDSRIFRIETIEEINAYLSSKGIVELSNPRSTPVIEDVWNFFPNSSHEFGWMVRGGLGITYAYQSSQTTVKVSNRMVQDQYDITNPSVVTILSESSSTSHTSRHDIRERSLPYFTLLVEKNKPITSRLQLNLTAQGWIYFSTTDTTAYDSRAYDGDSLLYFQSEQSDNKYESITRFALSGQLRYDFNGRTSASAYASYDRADYDQTNYRLYYNDGVALYGDTTVTDVGGYDLSVGAGVMYRISIPTTLSVNLSYDKSTISLFSAAIGKTSNDSYNFSVEIIHNIF